MTLTPISLSEANAFVALCHRHHKPVVGHKFSIGCEADGRLAGVAIVGRPVSRYLDDGKTLEVMKPVSWSHIVLLSLQTWNAAVRLRRQSVLTTETTGWMRMLP